MPSKSVKEKPNNHSSLLADKSKDFLLAEFKESADAWRFTDARIESAIRFYLSIFTAAAPVLAVLYSYLSDFKFFIGITIIVDCCLVGMGYVVIRRVTATDINKAKNLLSMQLIRRFFVDQNPSILPYLFYPVAKPFGDKNQLNDQVKPSFSKILILGINIANSILIGWITSGSVWLVSGIPILQLIIIGTIVATVCFMIFQIAYKRNIDNFKNSMQL